MRLANLFGGGVVAQISARPSHSRRSISRGSSMRPAASAKCLKADCLLKIRLPLVMYLGKVCGR
eukprot:6787042-Prorocentrum_lima.AAC.1